MEEPQSNPQLTPPFILREAQPEPVHCQASSTFHGSTAHKSRLRPSALHFPESN